MYATIAYMSRHSHSQHNGVSEEAPCALCSAVPQSFSKLAAARLLGNLNSVTPGSTRPMILGNSYVMISHFRPNPLFTLSSDLFKYFWAQKTI